MTSGSLHTYVSRKAEENYYDSLFFLQFAKRVERPAGTKTYQFMKVDSMAGSVAALTEGTVPSEVNFRLTAVTATPVGYGAWTKLSDELLKASPIDAIDAASMELGRDLAKQVDSAIQDTIDAGTNVIYSATEDASAGRTNVDDGDTITASLIAKATSYLEANNAPKFPGGYYMCVIHPHVLHDLKVESGTGAFIDVNKYAKPEQIMKGEVGALYGARFVTSANVQKYTNASDGAGSTGNVDVYPTYVFGADCYGVVTSGGFETFFKPLGSGGSGDPINQIATVGVKTYMAAKILNENGLYRIESSSSIGNNAS